MDSVARHQPRWAEAFTIFGDGRVDIQDASADVLCAAGIGPVQADTLVRHRQGADGLPGTTDDRIIKSLAEVSALLGLDGSQAESLATKFTVGAEPSRIDSVATCGEVRYRISNVVDRKQPRPVSLSWEEL